MTIRASDYLLLLHFDNNLTDSSPYGRIVTKQPTTGVSSFMANSDSVFNKYLYLVNSLALTVNDLRSSSDWNFPYGDSTFSIDFRFRPVGSTALTFFGQWFTLVISSSGEIALGKKQGTSTTTTIVRTNKSNNDFHHIAISKDSNNILRVYINGNLLYSADNLYQSYDLRTGTYLLKASSIFFLEEFRILGVCPDEYTQNSISVPTSPYTLPPENTYVFRPWLMQNQILSN